MQNLVIVQYLTYICPKSLCLGKWILLSVSKPKPSNCLELKPILDRQLSVSIVPLLRMSCCIHSLSIGEGYLHFLCLHCCTRKLNSASCLCRQEKDKGVIQTRGLWRVWITLWRILSLLFAYRGAQELSLHPTGCELCGCCQAGPSLVWNIKSFKDVYRPAQKKKVLDVLKF